MEDQEINNRAYIEPIEKFTDGYDYLEFKKKNDSQYVLEINDLILIVDMPNVFSSGIYWARFERKTINGVRGKSLVLYCTWLHKLRDC